MMLAPVASLEPLIDEYRSATPWPHLVIDDAVGADRAAACEAEEIDYARTLQPHRSARLVKAESPSPSGPTARRLLRELEGIPFVSFLEGLTSIRSLLPDPSHTWAGLYASGPGSFQAVHNDFPVHPATGLYHRVQVLLYLNSDWDPGFGGELELWDDELSACGARIAPLAGRMVIFETKPAHYHGVPDPLRVPEHRRRMTLAASYFTREPPIGLTRQSLFRRPRRPQDPWTVGWASPRDALLNLRSFRRSRTARDAGGDA